MSAIRKIWAVSGRGLRFVFGGGPFFFGATLWRTLAETAVVAALAFGLALPNIGVPDYRVLVLAYVPGGLASVLWAAVRLRSVRRWPGRIALMFGQSLLVGSVVVVVAGGISLANFALNDLAAPPVTFGGSLMAEAVANALLLWPDSLAPGAPNAVIFGLRALNSVLDVAAVFLLVRGMADVLRLCNRLLNRLTRRRLLWRLTLSHFYVVVASLIVTVFCWTALISLLAGSGSRNPGTVQTISARTARQVATAIETADGITAADIDAVLHRIKEQPANPTPLPPSPTRLVTELRGGDLTNMEYIVVLDRQSRVVASTDGARFAPGSAFVADDLTGPIVNAQAGETRLSALTVNRLRPAIVIAGAYPVRDAAGAVREVVVARAYTFVVFTDAAAVLGVLLVPSVAFLTVFAAVSLFSLCVAFAFGYVVARRLSRNLETLAAAADALAAGNLRQRADLDSADEIGRLAARFNTMAERLQESQTNLAQEKRTVEQALQTKRELVASVSHELRTPVSTIRAHVDWLTQTARSGSADAGGPPAETELYRYLDVIGREAQRLGVLIDDLLDLSRIEARPTLVERERVAVAAAVREVQQSLGAMAQRERKITLTLDLAPDLPPVWADRARLGQVLLNLTRNAINYTGAGGIVAIGAHAEEGDRVAVWVADTGIGIAPDDVSHIFERFYRADASRSRNTGGAGLGLAIVKTLVDAMGGTIRVSSVVGEGSIFTVSLPVASAATTPIDRHGGTSDNSTVAEGRGKP